MEWVSRSGSGNGRPLEAGEFYSNVMPEEGWAAGNKAKIIRLVIRGCGMRSTESRITEAGGGDALGDKTNRSAEPCRVSVANGVADAVRKAVS